MLAPLHFYCGNRLRGAKNFNKCIQDRCLIRPIGVGAGQTACSFDQGSNGFASRCAQHLIPRAKKQLAITEDTNRHGARAVRLESSPRHATGATRGADSKITVASRVIARVTLRWSERLKRSAAIELRAFDKLRP